MLEISNLSYAYPHRHDKVIDDFSLTLSPGGIYGLLGKNGVGKSTLLYLISGLLTPQKGCVNYNGINTRKRTPSVLADIFLVPEEFSLPPISLSQYVKVNSPFYPDFSEEDMARHLSTFGLSSDIRLNSLSMGQKKKVFMCFALACNTSLLLMDEPTNGLDIPGKSAFRKFIASSLRPDQTVIISTHQIRDIDTILDNVVIMDNRKVIFNQSVAEITQRLCFVDTPDHELEKAALYAQKTPGGNSLILPADGMDSELNLETLFNFALEAPETLNRLFNTERN